LASYVRTIGGVTEADRVRIRANGRVVIEESRTNLRAAWSETTYRLVERRDHPQCAKEQYETACDPNDPGLSASLTFDVNEDIAAPFIVKGVRPKVAILREQGVNSHIEMAAALYRAGFEPYDVHMTDLVSGRAQLADYRGFVACGGFSYGDVLGAGEGWAKSILFNAQLREAFSRFFARTDTFSL